jgi:hypothetical protein
MLALSPSSPGNRLRAALSPADFKLLQVALSGMSGSAWFQASELRDQSRSRLYGTGSCVMPITPFLAGQAFDSEIIHIMSTVFVSVRSRLGLLERTDGMNEVVAKTIIKLVQRGVHNQEMLRKMTLQEFNLVE